MIYRKTILFTLLAFVASFVAITASPADAADREVVGFRLASWKSAHFDNSKNAKICIDTLKKIGCEAKQHSHGDHIDVTYRCQQWRNISLKSHNEAHSWEKWLQAYGFETVHKH